MLHSVTSIAEILEAIPHIKMLIKNLDFSFVNQTIKQLIAKNKINNNFRNVQETEN